MKATNLILLTEDDYNQLAETIANRVIQQLQGKTHNVEQPKSDDGFVFQEEAAKLLGHFFPRDTLLVKSKYKAYEDIDHVSK